MTRSPRKIPGVENRPRQRRDGSTYFVFRVPYRDGSGERHVETFDSQSDAVDFRAQLRLNVRAGVLPGASASRMLMSELVEEWWTKWATQRLATPTLRAYQSVWNNHALPRLGQMQLRSVTPGVLAGFRDDLLEHGVKPPTVRKTLAMVQAMLRYAVEHDKVPVNAARQVRKPASPRTRAVRPFTPDLVERLRSALNLRDSILISVLAYAGPRPEDALALEWQHVRQGTLLFEQKNVDGVILPGQKVDGKPPRTTDLLDALRRDLVQWRVASGRPDVGLVFPREDGAPWRDHDYRNWRRRVWQPACASIGVGALTETVTYPTINGRRRRRVNTTWEGPRPYDLRHSYISLMIHEGRLSPIEIAAQVGNSAETILRTYAHIFAEMRDQPKVPAGEQIAAARTRARGEHGPKDTQETPTGLPGERTNEASGERNAC